MLRTHTCGELRISDVNKQVTLTGWVQRTRDKGGIIWIDLRDRYGKTQVIFSPERAPALVAAADKLKAEYVVAVRGKVRRRDKDTVNPKIATGEIELDAEEIEILNEAKTPPFPINDFLNVSEETRLQHRYLDLRRPTMQKHLVTRHKITHSIRASMDRQSFIEIAAAYNR